MAKFLRVKEVDSGNKYLPVPLEIGEIVTQIEDEIYSKGDAFMSQFVRVKHNGGKNISSFSKTNFEKYVPKNKGEILILTKKGGIMPKR